MLYNLFLYIKYSYYFNKLIFTSYIYYLYLSIYNKNNETFNIIIYNSINESGFFSIKLFQYLYNFYYSNIIDNDNDIFYKIYNNLYEKCKIHDLNYTKYIFNKDFCTNIDNIIEFDNNFEILSGSIGQVYKVKLKNIDKYAAMKVKHPYINQQLLTPFIYYKIYKFFTNKFFIFKKFKICIDWDSFFDNILKQTHFNNEANYLKYFYNIFKDNKFIIIPKPILWSDNILIMDYVEGINFDSLKSSPYIKTKIINIFNLFIKYSKFCLKYYHADLHSGNWKVNINNDKIIIYDFGLCNECGNHLFDIYNYISLNNIDYYITYMYNNFIIENPLNIQKNDIINYINNNNDMKNLTLISSKFNILLNNYFIKNKILFKSDIINMIINTGHYEYYIRKYLINKNEDITDHINNDYYYLYNSLNNKKLYNNKTILFCEDNNCCTEIIEYLKKSNNLINDDIIKLKSKYNINNNINIDNLNIINL